MNPPNLENRVRDRFLQSNQTLLVKAPRRTGKTWVVCKIAAALLRANKRVVVIVTCNRKVGEFLRQVACNEFNVEGDCLTYQNGCIHCTARTSGKSSILSMADAILVDDAPYMHDFHEELAKFIPTKRMLFIGTPTSKINIFSRMCKLRDQHGDPMFAVVDTMHPSSSL